MIPTVAGGNTLTFDNGASPASLTLASGSVAAATVASTIVLNSDLTITNNSAQTLTLSGAIDTAGHNLVINGSGPVVISGAISNSTGAGAVTQSGTGSLTLSGANTYSGSTAVSSGTLQINAIGAIPTSGALSVASGSTVILNASGATYHAMTVTGAGLVQVANLGTGSTTTALDSVNLNAFTGTLEIGPAATSDQGKVDLRTAISMPSASATLKIDYGATVYMTGALTLPCSVQLYGGATGEAYGQLRLDYGAAVTGAITLYADTTIGSYANGGTLSGSIGGPYMLTKVGTPILTLSGSNTYSGGTTVDAGTLDATNSDALGTTGAVTLVASHNGSTGTVLQLGGGLSFPSRLTLALNSSAAAGSLTSVINAVGSSAWNGPIILSGDSMDQFYATTGVLTLDGPISGSSFTGTLMLRGGESGIVDNTIDIPDGNVTVTDAGTWLINSTSNDWEATTVPGGRLVLGADDALPSDSVVSLGEGTYGGTLDLDGNSEEIGGLNVASGATASSQIVASSSTSSNAILTIDTAGGSSTFGGVLRDSVAGGSQTLALVVTGTNSLTLSGANTYSGGTTINGGSLLLTNTSGSATGTGSVTAASGATLGGSGSASGSVTINSGGNLSPGVSGVSTLSTGDLMLSPGSNLNIVINSDTPGTGYDQVEVTGSATITGSNLVLTGPYNSTANAEFNILTPTTTTTGMLGGSPSLNSVTYTANYSPGAGTGVALTVGVGSLYKVLLGEGTAGSTAFSDSDTLYVKSLYVTAFSPEDAVDKAVAGTVTSDRGDYGDLGPLDFPNGDVDIRNDISPDRQPITTAELGLNHEADGSYQGYLGFNDDVGIPNNDNNYNDRTWTVTVIPVVLNSLTATDDSDPTNTVTAGGGSSAGDDLYVAENPSTGSATIDLSADYTPTDAGNYVLWDVTGEDAAPASGSFNAGSGGAVVLTPTDDNYDYTVQAGVDENKDGVLQSYEVTQTINVHLFTADIEFNNTVATNDDVVMLTTPGYGSDIPADQSELDAAVEVLGDPPPGMTLTLDNPDGGLGFGAAAPSTQPTTQPSSPVSTQPTTQPFTASPDTWFHVPVFGLNVSQSVGDASVQVTATINGRTGGLILRKQGATVFWFANPKMDVMVDTPYQLQGGVYAPPNGAAAVDLSAQATIEPAGLDTTIPQLANLRISIVQNVNSEYLANVFGNPQMAWNTNYPNGAPINAGDQVTITAQVAQGVDLQLDGATFPLLDTVSDSPNTSPLYDPAALAEPMGYPNGNTADAFDAPNFRTPAPAGEGPVFHPTVPVVDGAALVGYATYSRYIKTIRQVSFTDWCVLVDITNGTTIIAPLAENEWAVDLDSSVGNQQATAGQSHLPTAMPVLAGYPADTFPRQYGYAGDYGPGDVTFTK